MTEARRDGSEIEAAFIFVPHGQKPPSAWLERHPGWIKIPATFVPHPPRPRGPSPWDDPWPDVPGSQDDAAKSGRPVSAGAPIRERRRGQPPAHPGQVDADDPIATYLRVSAAMDQTLDQEQAGTGPPPPSPAQDAIRPVYPLEILAGVGAAGWLGGAIAAVRAAGAGLLRQVVPDNPAPPPAQPTVRPSTTLEIVAPNGQQIGVVVGRSGQHIRTVSPSEFQAIEQQLMQGAVEAENPAYPGTWYRRPDGSSFGIRNSKLNGLTIDVSDLDLHPSFKVHQR